jgi:hypothetical protein
MNLKRSLHTIAVPSTSFTVEAYFDGQGASPAIRFGYEQNGREHRGGIKFSRVSAMRTRAERCCTPWHIEGVYDTLVEVDDSDWIAELRADTSAQWQNEREAHHYMIYLDSAGSFEIVAESWAALPDEIVS